MRIWHALAELSWPYVLIGRHNPFERYILADLLFEFSDGVGCFVDSLGLASFELVKCSSFHCTWRKAHSALLFFCPISVVTHLLIGGLLFLS